MRAGSWNMQLENVPFCEPVCSLGWCAVAGHTKWRYPIASLNNTSFFKKCTTFYLLGDLCGWICFS